MFIKAIINPIPKIKPTTKTPMKECESCAEKDIFGNADRKSDFCSIEKIAVGMTALKFACPVCKKVNWTDEVTNKTVKKLEAACR